MARQKNKGAAARYAETVLERLRAAYPDARCSLDHCDALQLLVATILSAQCTDERVNKVTPALFARYQTARDYMNADFDELAELIHSTGFFNNKAKAIIAAATAIVERHGGEVPASMDDLVRLPGVGRKTANVILGNAFGIASGVVVDTHVARLARRLGLTRATSPDKIEQDLMALFPQSEWTLLAHRLIDHGRAVCTARAPRCAACPLGDICPQEGVG